MQVPGLLKRRFPRCWNNEQITGRRVSLFLVSSCKESAVLIVLEVELGKILGNLEAAGVK